jgi:hypothetical protein
MAPSKTLKTAVGSVLALIVLLTSLFPLLLSPKPAEAQGGECGEFGATVEIKYDDGYAEGQMSDIMGICPKCHTYQGVLFTLPGGISSSILKKVSFYAGGGKGKVRVHVYGTAPVRKLTDPVIVPITEDAWYSVSLANVAVPSKFYVFVERADKIVMPFYDVGKQGPSLICEKPSEINPSPELDPPGDFLIRAYIVPEAHVGAGQDHETIQEAVDAVGDGWKLIVHDGTYNENVTINKSLTIESFTAGGAKVKTPYANEDVFTITANCVTLSRFDIAGASANGTAGVRIEEATGCVIRGNVIHNNYNGVAVSQGSTGNIVVWNWCPANSTGIYVDGSQNYINGNRLDSNTAMSGAAVLLSSYASGNQLRFNTITIDKLTYPEMADYPQVVNQNTTQSASAVDNWWGTNTGPLVSTNPAGEGPRIGDMVTYDPWLPMQAQYVDTAAAWSGDFTLDVRDEAPIAVIKRGAGTPIVSIATFAGNPCGEFLGKPLNKWMDVLLSSSDGVDEIEIRVYYTTDELTGLDLKEGSLRLFWWNGKKWKTCSKTGVDKDNDFLWGRLTLKTKPAPTDLTGTMFAAGVPKGPGFAWWLIPVILVAGIIFLLFVRLVWVLAQKRGEVEL